jgi:hypothetical protein
LKFPPASLHLVQAVQFYKEFVKKRRIAQVAPGSDLVAIRIFGAKSIL